MSRLYRRRDRIHDQVQITSVLAHYGYRVHPENYEQQFPCDLHGDGLDAKPSGRVYPQSNSFYCFACDQSRDPIGLVMEKENVEFAEAIKILEQLYGLPELPWEDSDFQPREKTVNEELNSMHEEMSRRGSTYERERNRVDRLLYSISQERSLPMSVVMAYYEAFDRISWSVEKQYSTPDVGREAMIKLRTRIMNKLEVPT